MGIRVIVAVQCVVCEKVEGADKAYAGEHVLSLGAAAGSSRYKGGVCYTVQQCLTPSVDSKAAGTCNSTCHWLPMPLASSSQRIASFCLRCYLLHTSTPLSTTLRMLKAAATATAAAAAAAAGRCWCSCASACHPLPATCTVTCGQARCRECCRSGLCWRRLCGQASWS
jgi:hypothetical protein